MIRVLFDMNRIFNFYRIFKFSSSQWYIDGITRYTLSLLKAMQEMDIFHIEYVVYENISDNIHKFEALFKFEALLKNETSLPAYNTLFLRDKKIQNPDMEAALKQAHIYFIPYLCHEFPKVLEKYSQLKVMLMIHDLIPLIYPTSFCEGGDDFIKLKKWRDMLCGYKGRANFLVNSYATQKDLQAMFGVEDQDIILAPLASDAQIFHPVSKENNIDFCKEYNLTYKKYFLYITRLEERKNIRFFLNTFIDFAYQNSEMYLVIVGRLDRGYSKSLQFFLVNIINRYPDVMQRILLIPCIEDASIAKLYSSAMALVYPSLYEGFGLPLLESMLCHTPVLASNVSSLPEVGGDAVLYFDPTDKQDLQDKMHSITRDQDLRDDLVRRGQQQAQKFSWKKTVERSFQSFMTTYC